MKNAIALALVVGAVIAPAANASRHNDQSENRGAVEYVFQGVVTSDASAVSVDVAEARGLSKHARRSLAGATTFTVKLGAATKVRGKHGANVAFRVLHAGDRVEVMIRAPRGIAAADLPAAKKIVVRGSRPSAQPPVVVPPVVDPPVVEPPMVDPAIVEPPVMVVPVVVVPVVVVPVVDEPVLVL